MNTVQLSKIKNNCELVFFQVSFIFLFFLGVWKSSLPFFLFLLFYFILFHFIFVFVSLSLRASHRHGPHHHHTNAHALNRRIECNSNNFRELAGCFQWCPFSSCHWRHWARPDITSDIPRNWTMIFLFFFSLFLSFINGHFYFLTPLFRHTQPQRKHTHTYTHTHTHIYIYIYIYIYCNTYLWRDRKRERAREKLCDR